MLTRIACSLLILMVLVVFSSEASAQAFPQAAERAPSTQPFNARDLNGIWDRSGGGDRGMGPRPGVGVPPMTPEGKAMFEASKPSYGPRAVPPAVGNDIVGECNPQGIPRIIFFPRPVEFIQLPDRILQVYQWHRALREIWMDGRELPAQQPDLPSWYGYSIARWEGNTLVVDSAGYDERGWLDMYGYPRSSETRVRERYTRTAYDRIELEITVTDPKIYTTPWVSEKKTFRLLPREDTKIPGLGDAKGWYGLTEELCVPLDEVDFFNQRIRNPAAGIK